MYKDLKNIKETVTDVTAINNAIKNILLTEIGSLPGKPKFGSNINKVLFNQLDHITIGILKDSIKQPLKVLEPRIIVLKVDVENVAEYNKIVANIHYRYRDAGVEINDQVSITFYQ